MMVSVMMPSSSPSSAYFSFSSSSTLLPLVIATRRRFLEFLLSQKEYLPMLFKHSRKSSCFWNTPRYPSANTLVSFIFLSTFLFLSVYGGIFIQPLMRIKPLWAFLAIKKEWPFKVSIPYCVWRSTNLFLSLTVLHILRKQKKCQKTAMFMHGIL